MMMSTSETYPHIGSSTALPAALKIWEIFLRDQNKSNYTIKAFLGDMQLLVEFLPPDIGIGDVTTLDLNRFFEWLENGRGKDIPCSPKSLSRRVTTIKSFFRWLVENARIMIDPAEKILQKTVISPLPEILSSDEEKRVIDTAFNLACGENKDSRFFVLLKLLLEAGIKKSECLSIKTNHIFSEDDTQYLFVRYADQKDRNKERKILLSNEWVTKYQEYKEQYEIEDVVFPWSQRRLEYLLEEIGEKAGLTKHLSFSMCRWNSALSDLRKGVEKEAIRQKLGISKIQWREISNKLEKLLELESST